MNEIKLTGGARIGMANATYPFASLIVSKDKLELNASIIGNLIFQPKDIISIETYKQFPIIGKGIKINHRVSNYKQKVIFWTLNPEEVLNQIKDTGFLDTINSENSPNNQEIIKKQKQGGSPLRRSFVIGAIVLWISLLGIDFFNFFYNGMQGEITAGKGTLAAISLLFGSAVLSLVSSDFRKLLLKDGKDLDDIKKFLYIIIFVSGFLLVNILLLSNILIKNK